MGILMELTSKAGILMELTSKVILVSFRTVREGAGEILISPVNSSSLASFRAVKGGSL